MADWTKLGERPLHDGWRRVVGRSYRTPDGVVREYEIKLEDDTAAVLALTADEQVVLVREFRPGPEESLLELPGGAVSAGKSRSRPPAVSSSRRQATPAISVTWGRSSTARTRPAGATRSSRPTPDRFRSRLRTRASFPRSRSCRLRRSAITCAAVA